MCKFSFSVILDGGKHCGDQRDLVICGSCVNWESIKRKKTIFVWFHSVKLCQVKFVYVALYPIQCLNGLSRPTTETS